MATILESPNTEVKETVKDNVIFFQIMREKLEYQKLQAMKEVADAKYKVKSYSRQVREIEKTILRIKEGKPIKMLIPTPEPVSTPCLKFAEPKILKPIEVVKEAQDPIPTVHHGLFMKPSPNHVSYVQTYRHDWKCEKCKDLSFPNRKLLKEHISNIHSY